MITLTAVHTQHALRDVSLNVAPGEVVAVIGPSGSGKSTLLRSIVGLEPLTHGSVDCFGLAVSTQTLRAVRQCVGLCFQDFQLFPHLRVRDNVTLALRLAGMPTDKAMAALQRVDCAELADRYPSSLSGGQKQRVALARALALEPAGILLDEPVSALDPECVADVVTECRDLAKAQKAVVVTTHHLPFARAIAHRVVFLVGGCIVEKGTPAQIFDAPQSERLKTYLAHCLGD